MKIRLFQIIFLMFLLLISSNGSLLAQELDENGYPILKKLTEEDARRIFGDMFAPKILKTQGESRYVKESIINGNKITTIVFNYGSICEPNRLPNVADMVWQGLGYGFEFGPLAAAEVVGDSGQTLQIVSDSFIRTYQGDWSPDGTIKWGWLPKNGFVDTTQNEIARLNIGDEDGDGKPDSWPERWYSPGAGKYIWPAFLGDQATAPDEEVFYVVDDYTNAEFAYTPSPSNPSMRGLGLDMEVRIIQFNNPLAEDIIFLVNQVTNASEKDLNRVYFGYHGDPHVGGQNNYSDDLSGFIDPEGNSLQVQNPPQRARSMVYSWDEDMTGDGGRPCGYFGWKFLESPSIADDGDDNDLDGIRDETPFNSAGNFIDGVSIPLETGIYDVPTYTEVFGAPKPRFEGDEDGDWNPDKDDIGIDGIGPDSPNYPGPDLGEGDGTPSQAWYDDVNNNSAYDSGEPLSVDRLPGYKWAGSEPNFGLRDISESDQLGLQSFHAAVYGNSTNVPMQDDLMWQWMSSDTIDASQELLSQPGDNVFNFATGPLALESGEAQRFSMAILFGNDLDDLLLNAETSTKILEADYRFAQPPAKPIVQVVPGDGKVTLYWDSRAETSVDPLTGEEDFQGYKIYRSRDYTFSDVFTITDGKGNPFLGKPLSQGGQAAQFDLVDDWSGFHPIEYEGRAVKFYLGDNTGLVHEYVDSSVTNGITYYYAVVAYDSGTDEIPPTENQAVILRDPVTGVLTFDVNTAAVTPNPLGSGLVSAEAGVGGIPDQVVGNSTGDIRVKVLDELQVKNKLYSIKFTDAQTFDVLDSTGVTETFISKDTVFADLSKTNIKEGSIEVRDAGGNLIDPSRYFVNVGFGKIRGVHNGDLPIGEEFTIKYRYYPVYQSKRIDNSDANPSFDGLKVYVNNEPLDLDEEACGWLGEVNTNIIDSVLWSTSNAAYVGNPHVQYRADWEIRWKDLDTLSDGSWANVGDSTLSVPSFTPTACPFEIVNISEVDNEGNYVKGEFFVWDKFPATAANGKWDWGEPILLKPTGATGATVSYFVQFMLKPDSLKITETVIDDTTSEFDTVRVSFDPILPQDGDVYVVRTSKPFQPGDEYKFETQAVKYDRASAERNLDDIYVVPNPYVAYSIAEEPGRTSEKRGDRQLQFRNLPPTCTIRIYTITGELVQKIEKDDNSSIAYWDLLSSEGQRIAYGVYIFHVDVPGVGEKIGRFAVIK